MAGKPDTENLDSLENPVTVMTAQTHSSYWIGLSSLVYVYLDQQRMCHKYAEYHRCSPAHQLCSI